MLRDKRVADMVFGFTGLANDADTIDEVDHWLAARLEPYGVTNFILVQATDRTGAPTAALLAGRSNSGWRAHYTERGFAARDEMLPRATADSTYTTWAQLRAGPMSAEQARIFDEASEFGHKDGFFLPIQQRDRATYAMAMFSREELEADGRFLPALHMIGLYYALAARRLVSRTRDYLCLPEEKPVALTRRQRECLQHVREGRTDREIAEALGLSEHTVIEHLEGARRRLNVKTRTQAVMSALHYGLIDV